MLLRGTVDHQWTTVYPAWPDVDLQPSLWPGRWPFPCPVTGNQLRPTKGNRIFSSQHQQDQELFRLTYRVVSHLTFLGLGLSRQLHQQEVKTWRPVVAICLTVGVVAVFQEQVFGRTGGGNSCCLWEDRAALPARSHFSAYHFWFPLLCWWTPLCLFIRF